MSTILFEITFAQIDSTFLLLYYNFPSGTSTYQLIGYDVATGWKKLKLISP